ncbi:MAG TPA: PilZ domain-containing protein [Terriglobales bacterium]|nr:PilZ domain-containing protein [Terriglobales bacterium]
MHERRKFERVALPPSAKVVATTAEKEVLGPVAVIGRGGLLVDTQKDFRLGQLYDLVVVDEREGIQRPLRVVARYRVAEGVGFEFDGLDADAAVEIGVIIGKHYSAGAGR